MFTELVREQWATKAWALTSAVSLGINIGSLRPNARSFVSWEENTIK
jgi:hypothetical protein